MHVEKLMLKIGYFARISQVTVKALHYYDRLGLLKPAQVDPFTNYRYYTIDQLPRLNRILALKDLGLSLEQIALLLKGDVSSEEIRGMLRLRQSQLQEQAKAVAEELARVEARLCQIAMEETMPDLEVVLKTTESMIVAARRLLIPTNDQVPAMLGPAFDEVCVYVQNQKAQIAGPCFALWHSSPETYTDEDVEATYPIDRVLPGNEQVTVYELPATQVAAVVHHGDVDEFTEGHKTLLKWMEANGYRLNGAYREIYHDWQDHRNATTEIQFPVEKVSQ
jgi:DNA-binding transcriptional MerR regulator/predicted transcriptional regulator YdeE